MFFDMGLSFLRILSLGSVCGLFLSGTFAWANEVEGLVFSPGVEASVSPDAKGDGTIFVHSLPYEPSVVAALIDAGPVYLIFSKGGSLSLEQRLVFERAFSEEPDLKVPVFVVDITQQIPDDYQDYMPVDGMVLGFREGYIEVNRSDLMAVDQVWFLSNAVMLFDDSAQ